MTGVQISADRFPATHAEIKPTIDIKVTEFQQENQGWRKHLIKITDVFAECKPLISQDTIPLLSRGNIAVIIGKAKSKKSFLMTMLASCIEDDASGFCGADDLNSIVYADTEQSEYHVLKVLQRIYRLCGWSLQDTNDKVTMLALREKNPKERWVMIKEVVEEMRPDLIIIDGVRDLVSDFNDLRESSDLVNDLMGMTARYNCGLMTVIHQNKGDNNARGHLGTELMNKSETVLQVVNQFGVASVSPVHCRNVEIEPFSFQIVNGLPIPCEPPAVIKKRQELLQLFSETMQGVSWISKSELVRRLVEKTGKSEKTCTRRIDDALSCQVLKKSINNTLFLAPNGYDESEDLPLGG